MEIEELVRLLSLSLAPTIMISAAGLILLSLTNRLARSIDRIRAIIKENSGNLKEGLIIKQIKILNYRSKIIKNSIVLMIGGIASSVLTILLLALSLILNINLSILIIFFFLISWIFLLISLLYFIYDVTLALDGLKIEYAHSKII